MRVQTTITLGGEDRTLEMDSERLALVEYRLNEGVGLLAGRILNGSFSVREICVVLDEALHGPTREDLGAGFYVPDPDEAERLGKVQRMAETEGLYDHAQAALVLVGQIMKPAASPQIRRTQ